MIDNIKEVRTPAPKCRVNKHGEVVLTMSVEAAQFFRAVVGNTAGDVHGPSYLAWDKLDDVCRNLPGYFFLGEDGSFCPNKRRYL